MKRFIGMAAMVASVVVAGPAWAACTPTTQTSSGTDCGPPANAGTAFLDLAGTTLPSVLNTGMDSPAYVTETGSFTATASQTAVTLAFRNDAAFWLATDLSLQANGTGPNLFSNGDFSGSLYDGVRPGLPAGWSLDYQGNTPSNHPGLPGIGQLSDSCSALSGVVTDPKIRCWIDGANNGYDSLSQVVATTPGTVYTFSFLLNSTDVPGTTIQQTGAGNTGLDVIAFDAAVGTPVRVPEPAALALLALGLAGLVVRRRR